MNIPKPRMKIPRHIALIPDGNRRWAKERGLKPWEGHKAGIERFDEFVDWCYDLGVEEITAYSLSQENLGKRTGTEMKFLFKLYEKNLLGVLKSQKAAAKGIRIRFVGDLSPFPKSLRELMAKTEEDTKKFKGGKLNLCVNYSGREEILNAAKELVRSKKPINEKNFEDALLVKSAPDLLIRTAEKRISNFLLWQSAYSEIYFSPRLFPDFNYDDFMDAIKEFNQTERRYGK